MDSGDYSELHSDTYNAASRLLDELSSIRAELSEVRAMLASRDGENAVLREEINSLKSLRNNNVVSGDGGGGGSVSPQRKKLRKISNLTTVNNSVNNSVIVQPGSTIADFSSATDDSAHSANIAGQNGSASATYLKVGRTKKKKVIQTLDADIKTIRSSIKNANCKGFSLKQTNVKAPIKITIDSHDEIPVIRNALISNNISFHEFKLPYEKQQAFVIRGLVGANEGDLPSVLQELVGAGIPSEAKLSLLVTGHMKANLGYEHNTLLKLVVPADFDANVLQNIKFLDHVVVTFEKLKSKSVVQCKNCQRFGHSAGGCQHIHRCVKCGNNHLRDGCPRTNNKSVKLSCCNCGGEHTANNLSVCPFFQKYNTHQSAPARKSTSRPLGSNNISAARVAGTSFNSSNNVHFQTYASAAAAGAATTTKKASSANNTSTTINLVDISNKLDLIMQMVSRHETLLQQLGVNV